MRSEIFTRPSAQVVDHRRERPEWLRDELRLVTNPNEPFPSLTKEIFDAAQSAPPAQQQQAWAGILVLILLIFVLNLAIRYFARSRHAAAK